MVGGGGPAGLDTGLGVLGACRALDHLLTRLFLLPNLHLQGVLLHGEVLAMLRTHPFDEAWQRLATGGEV